MGSLLIDRPKDLPNSLECAYCKRCHKHGGECQGKAAIGMRTVGWVLYNQDTEIRINKIYRLSWNERKGLLSVKCNFDYYVNEFCEEYKNESSKPNLKVIK